MAMTKAQNLREPDSCLNKAGPNEPLFILRAKDPLAAMTIRHWAAMAGDIHESDKIRDAHEAADRMESWYYENIPQPTSPQPPPSPGEWTPMVKVRVR